ncbi:MAG: DUF4325 domain-containing protein [Candidatus Micrarchaeia archaeon]
MKEISITRVVSIDLALRNTANAFFNELERYKEKNITVNFKGVKSISRSFAHQYLENKKNSEKIISETNIPDNVEKMFQVVENPTRKYQLVDLQTVCIQTL